MGEMVSLIHDAAGIESDPRMFDLAAGAKSQAFRERSPSAATRKKMGWDAYGVTIRLATRCSPARSPSLLRPN